ncbi:hypothetical protein C5167_049229 [Papaver somniferum]|uniref:VAN3-binding protein-like auxin canalisation domain-containing protein n=1 Tax=Papaver somniferum TaxID=3469 RepID=A0A4Y7KN36_PAPSO|nr:VAN3-binding protein-like [Papaver somniferum]RZC73750.1 hypothetical protein C5167_049229 [Papaver somniferum]
MDSDFRFKAPPPQVPTEPMDFLSRDYCNSKAVQIFQPDVQDRALVLQNHSMRTFTDDVKPPHMDDGDFKSLPPWKSSNDVKSWISLQQAMHPEINYNRKKWFSWKVIPLKNLSIKKWVKEIKQKRKKEDRLQRAEVHAAISVAGVAAALAAIAAENMNKQGNHHQANNNNTGKESAIASAAALVAAQCAQMAEAMGAKRDQLSNVLGSAMSTANATDILTLTAAAATSLRGADTLRGRPGRSERLTGGKPILAIEDNKDDTDCDFNFEKFRSVLSKGSNLSVESSDGKFKYRSVSIVLDNESKVILKTRKANMLSAFVTTKESVVLDLHAELYQESLTEECDTCYYIVLTTSKGTIKLDMENDYERYSMWAMTTTYMLRLSTTFTGYDLQSCRS